jgi:hypothetical protein
VCGSPDNPRMSIVSKESKDTLTGGVSKDSKDTLTGGGLVYMWIPGQSQDDIVSKESKDTLTGGGLVYVDPGTIPGCHSV